MTVFYYYFYKEDLNGIFIYIVKWVFLIFILTGCGDNHNRSDVWANIDLSKKGVVYENDVILQDNIFYRFSLGYIQNGESIKKESEEAEKIYKRIEEQYKHISVFKMMGMGGYSSDTYEYKMRFEGSKIVLKFTLTPYKKMPHDYLYIRGDNSHNTTLEYPREEPFKINMDLSKYSYIYHTRAKDNKLCKKNL